MAREFTRSDRVAAQIQRELADLIRTDLKNPHVGWVSVHEVEVSRDLAVATIYLGFLTETADSGAALAALRGATPFLRRELGRRMKLRAVPELRFQRDESFERGARIHALLKSVTPPDGHDPAA